MKNVTARAAILVSALFLTPAGIALAGDANTEATGKIGLAPRFTAQRAATVARSVSGQP